MSKYEVVIGLETHIELLTQSKLFCGCSAKFGGPPNTNVCPVCLGHPGVMPALNRKAAEFTVIAGLALGCKIAPLSYMDRKHYFYPDLPKAFQTSQFHHPICVGGGVTLSDGRVMRLNHIHLEEDAGKLLHERGKTLVDYNRGGVPLMEIVGEPDLRSAADAAEYLEILQGIMRTVGVSDCRMQEGSMRCDVNISLRLPGAEYGIRAEIKNLNSFVSVRQAIEYETERQSDILDAGGEVKQETRGFDAGTGETYSRRGKENSDDYRYFPEPDIIPVRITPATIARLSAQIPELPRARAARYTESFGLSEKDAALLSKYRKVAEYFDAAVAESSTGNGKSAANLMLSQMFAKISTEAEREEWSPPISAGRFGELIALADSGKINGSAAKRVLNAMWDSGKSAAEVVSELGLDGPAVDVESLCGAAIAANPSAAADFKAGKSKALQAIIGYVMKASRGKAPADEVHSVLIRLLSE
ncbi:MAG: Asp-tRNA(Asn)/Glu-tRNA(Gln) amidotransferase subunit GatB [Oscillospiraceae bacterium]|jgi:aspartyl-tRNA(Asn)/glutamyl-tRNA(Gln) amidotransferase subunit B|nr:Asp-tRNA(Asn)/Glu-tRNA(Gln) amidotransferase subunit GatB [Oscillospiraceae bacterium]